MGGSVRLPYAIAVAHFVLASCTCAQSRQPADADASIVDAGPPAPDSGLDATADGAMPPDAPDDLVVRIRAWTTLAETEPMRGAAWVALGADGSVVVEGTTPDDGLVLLELPTSGAPYDWTIAHVDAVRSITGIATSIDADVHGGPAPSADPGEIARMGGSIRGRDPAERVFLTGPGIAGTELEVDEYAIDVDLDAPRVELRAFVFQPRYATIADIRRYLGVWNGLPLRAIVALPSRDPRVSGVPSVLDVDVTTGAAPAPVPYAMLLPTTGVSMPAIAHVDVRAHALGDRSEHVADVPVGPDFVFGEDAIRGTLRLFDEDALRPDRIQFQLLDADGGGVLTITVPPETREVVVPPIARGPSVSGSTVAELMFGLDAPGWSSVRWGIIQERADDTAATWICIDTSGVLNRALPALPAGTNLAALGFDVTPGTTVRAFLSPLHSLRPTSVRDLPQLNIVQTTSPDMRESRDVPF